MQQTTVRLHAPYLLYLGDCPDWHHAKTGAGLLEWCRDKCAAQLRLPECGVDLGLPDMTAADAAASGIRTVVVGIAPVGGALPAQWLPDLIEFARLGIDIAAGMHTHLATIPELAAAANDNGAKLIDVRIPPAGIPVGSGRKRSGKRVLMIGTDCAIGKKYTALALARELDRRGINATFRATGQTGIMIAGSGIPIDAVVADFISGAAEVLTPDNDDDHWDVIEGQGSLLHPGYSGVSLGLLHGSQPDAFVLCHDVARTRTDDAIGDYDIPDLDVVIDDALQLARRTNPACFCAGVSINTSSLGEFERDRYLAAQQAKLGLPCVDPIATGTSAIASFLLQTASAQ